MFGFGLAHFLCCQKPLSMLLIVAFLVHYLWFGTRQRNLSVDLPAFENLCFALGGMKTT